MTWGPVAPGNATWNPVAPSQSSWTTQSPSQASWTAQSPAAESWNPQSVGLASWEELPVASTVVLIDDDNNRFKLDPATAALMQVAYEHKSVHDGDHYEVVSYQDLTQGQVLQFTFQTPNTTKWLHWTWDISNEAETLWQVFEGGTISSALSNTIVPTNNNRNSSNASGSTLKYDIHADTDAADAAVDVSGAVAIASGINGSGRRSGGEENRERELVLKQNTLYVLRATATVAGYINFNMQWYELTNVA